MVFDVIILAQVPYLGDFCFSQVVMKGAETSPAKLMIQVPIRLVILLRIFFCHTIFELLLQTNDVQETEGSERGGSH